MFGEKDDICLNCAHHVRSDDPGNDDWFCDNPEAEYYGLETGAEDGCEDFTWKGEKR